MGVHRAAPVLREGLGHERRVDPVLPRGLLDHDAVGHEVVGHRQRVGVAQVDLVLAGRDLVVAELDADPHGLQRVDRLAPEVVLQLVGGVVEVPALVQRRRVVRPLEQEELHLRVHVEAEPEVRRPRQVAPQHLPRVSLEQLPLRRVDVAEHPPDPRPLRHPRQHLERRRSGRASMSDSCTRANPSTALPSNPIPSANAPSSSLVVTANDFNVPSTSVNHNRTNPISRSSTVRSTYSCCLSIGRQHARAAPARPSPLKNAAFLRYAEVTLHSAGRVGSGERP